MSVIFSCNFVPYIEVYRSSPSFDAIEYFIVGENTFQVQALESRNIEVQHEACVQYTFTVFHPTTFGSQSDRIHTQ